MPILAGRPASSPEALMRSRFAAYAVGAISHLVESTHPDGPHFKTDRVPWEAELRAFCVAMSFDGLVIHETGEEGERGFVDFTARLSQSGEDRSFRERSRFLRVDGRWLYFSGEPDPG
jgi:SEC-C motif-containing protein